MADVLDEKAGADAPSTSHVRDLLQQISDIAARYAPARPPTMQAHRPPPTPVAAHRRAQRRHPAGRAAGG